MQKWTPEKAGYKSIDEQIERQRVTIQRNAQRRYERLKSQGRHSTRQWKMLVAHYCPDGRCLCCGNIAKMTKDHVTPLQQGGSDRIGNIQPLCLECNQDKGTSQDNKSDYRPDRGAYARSLE